MKKMEFKKIISLQQKIKQLEKKNLGKTFWIYSVDKFMKTSITQAFMLACVILEFLLHLSTLLQ